LFAGSSALDANRLLRTGGASNLFRYPQAHFAKKTDKKKDLKAEKDGEQIMDPAVVPKKKSNSKKEEEPQASGSKTTSEGPKKTKKLPKKMEDGENAKTTVDATTPPPPTVHRLYTLKFNSPILPFSKFPLT
jgi:hypothetical protein